MDGMAPENPPMRRKPEALVLRGLRANSSPELLPVSPRFQSPEDDALEVITANAKALLRLVDKFTFSGDLNANDKRSCGRVAPILALMDEVKARLEARTAPSPRGDENQKARKELTATPAARKSLERMFSSLGKEKEIMAGELARKARELDEMEEIVADLKAQNEKLLARVQALTSSDRTTSASPPPPADGGGTVRMAALQERNKVLSDQLLKSIESYRSMKRKYKDAQEANAALHASVAGYDEIRSCIARIRASRSRDGWSADSADFENILEAIERICRRSNSRHDRKAKEEAEEDKMKKAAAVVG
ncbi:hypothetical protein EJ110_NYTH36277 [Nymphaea thermarum]|nr:hypothetical protein EJ110_NYTH36277 [Nymphaea thermarum]